MPARSDPNKPGGLPVGASGLRTTLADLARALDVSMATVSYALRGGGSISADTRQRVRAAAIEMGYRPNSAASLLALQRHRPGRQSGRLGVALLSAQKVWPGETDAFAAACAPLGLDAVRVSPSEFPSPRAALRALWQRGIDGIWLDMEGLPQQRWSEKEWAGADWDRFAVIKRTRVWPLLRFHLVRHSSFDFMLESLAQIFARGYRRVGVLLLRTPSGQDDLGRIGAVHAFREECMPADGRLELWAADSFARTRPLPAALARKIDRFAPDAILGFPYAWIEILRLGGMRVPEDIGFAAVYTHPEIAFVRGISGCDNAGEEMANRAAQRLFKLIETKQRGMVEHPVEDVIEPVWHDGDTLPRLSDSRRQSKRKTADRQDLHRL